MESLLGDQLTVWAQIINSLLGVCLMAAPGVLQLDNPAADMFYILGPVAATFATVSWWEATRNVRLGNVPIGLWLIGAPWILGFSGDPATIASVSAGVMIGGLALVRGRVEKSYGGGWSALVRSHADQ